MKKTPRAPADFVRAPLPDERLLGLWSGVERAESRARRRKQGVRRALAGAAALGVMIGILVLSRGWQTSTPLAQVDEGERVLETGARELSLPDGSSLALTGETRARVVRVASDEVRVRVERGEIACEVAPDRGRRFVVEAGAFEVVVTGTRFTVAVGDETGLPAGVSVRVERGSVEVWEPSLRVLARLGAGQLWASESAAVGAAAPAPAVAAPLETPAAAKSAAPPRAVATPSAKNVTAAPSAHSLLARASRERLEGDANAAAATLEELLRRHPTDDGAGYAAFMLGRLRLDALDDAAGAAEAFSFAAAHPGAGFFVEDAEARRVEALAKAGRAGECRVERERFLQKYAESPSAARVSRACEVR